MRRRLPPPIPLVKQKGRPASATRRCPVEIRVCKHHGETEFALYSAGKPRRRWRCKRCVGEAVTRRLQKMKRILVEEAGGACAICGYRRTVVNLHFHHVDPTTKSFAISTASGKSLDTFRDEAKKCVLLCANCHGEVETGRIESPPPGAKFPGLVAHFRISVS